MSPSVRSSSLRKHHFLLLNIPLQYWGQRKEGLHEGSPNKRGPAMALGTPQKRSPSSQQGRRVGPPRALLPQALSRRLRRGARERARAFPPRQRRLTASPQLAPGSPGRPGPRLPPALSAPRPPPPHGKPG
ncbi:collagen alpha-1(IX) chain-like [Podarcis raffonei]|uniref:collagen alpha-1(IX) chain-like n=1 Tax=Podarcis raffonei TaxID=65483 RepID=UPI0023290D34|nr:collagen alpha-1(IX) chain-like [Podarcis raffonei]